jgi:PiT family inorganic phosphate transporter
MLGLNGGMLLILILCIITACVFEFINGFHDTANAVATVIYTNSMKPVQAVIFSGIGNFIGVFIGIAVAMAIVNLLPLALLLDQNVAHSTAMIMALLLTAILWNLGTWYLGIPCSSSHTLFGSIFGVGIAFGLISETGVIALNMQKVKDVLLSLLISPIIGFGLTMATVIFMKKKIKIKKLFTNPVRKRPPPFWIRLTMILTCASVSIFHGSNDGQKGIGLVMIILIALVPVQFSVNNSKKPEVLLVQVNNIEKVISGIDQKNVSSQNKVSLILIQEKIDTMKAILSGQVEFKNLRKEDHFEIRKDILLLSGEINSLLFNQSDFPVLVISAKDKGVLKHSLKEARGFTEYAPWWVVLMISISLGLGTMIGWKRIVVTVGEKIGKEKLNYAQGASSNFITAITIGLSTWLGLPVSTTHVLSSGVAGSMVATHGIKNLRMKTVKNIMIAWLVTIPVTIIVAGSLFLLFRTIF